MLLCNRLKNPNGDDLFITVRPRKIILFFICVKLIFYLGSNLNYQDDNYNS